MKLFKKDYYEKLFAENPKTVGDYQLQIAIAQDKIRELQAKCEHSAFKVTFYTWPEGVRDVVRLCGTCGLVHSATQEEKDFLWRNSYLS